MLADRDIVVMQEPDMRRHLIAIVAGFAAEKVEFGFVSTGVHDDLHAATGMAREMVTSYGMSEALGPVTIGEKAGEVFLGASLQELGSVGPATLELIDREVERIVGDAVARAEEVLRANWTAVYEVANALIEHETLSGVALDAVLSTVQPTLLDLTPRRRRTLRPPTSTSRRGTVSRRGKTALSLPRRPRARRCSPLRP